jgi:endonuclease/exonuclease/phosphatase family metal-dependent hydrolase
VEVLDQRHAGATDVPWCTLAARIGVPGLGDVLFIATTSSWRLSAEAANPAARQEISAVVGQSGYRRRLDYILTGSRDAHPDASCAIRSAQLVFTEAVDGVWPSDHFGVLAELDVSAG